VETIDKIATKHGFKLGGFRSFERAITDDEIASIKKHRQISLKNSDQFKMNSQPSVDPIPL
jgi:hypothetical protein